jgi:hypothetical protein
MTETVRAFVDSKSADLVAFKALWDMILRCAEPILRDDDAARDRFIDKAANIFANGEDLDRLVARWQETGPVTDARIRGLFRRIAVRAASDAGRDPRSRHVPWEDDAAFEDDWARRDTWPPDRGASAEHDLTATRALVDRAIVRVGGARATALLARWAEVEDLRLGARSLPDLAGVQASDPQFKTHEGAINRRHGRLREAIIEELPRDPFADPESVAAAERYVLATRRKAVDDGVRSGRPPPTSVREVRMAEEKWTATPPSTKDRGEGFAPGGLPLAAFEEAMFPHAYEWEGEEIARSQMHAVWRIPARWAGAAGSPLAAEPELALVDARSGDVTIPLPGGRLLTLGDAAEIRRTDAALIVPLDALRAAAVRYSAPVVAQAQAWAASAEPLDRVAAAGLLMRGGRPADRSPAGVLAFIRDGAGARVRAWAAEWAADDRASILQRALITADDLRELFEAQEAAEADALPVAWLADERERLACVSAVLPGAVVAAALEAFDRMLLDNWPGLPARVPVAGWRADVAEVQSDGWWLGFP